MKRRSQLTVDQLLTADEAYQRTATRKICIERRGYTVVEKWECELNRELKANPEMKEFFDNVKIVDPMDPREGI
jgi:G:T-mismatch repair DNA endonuclease (very short patch repair protein)